MTLVMAMSGVVHDAGCSVRGERVYKVVAPDLPREDVVPFLEARHMDGCRMCLRPLSSTRKTSTP